jgi:hypothetical protein
MKKERFEKYVYAIKKEKKIIKEGEVIWWIIY